LRARFDRFEQEVLFMNWRSVRWLICYCFLLPFAGPAQAADPIGLFTDHADVGTVLHPGSVVYDPARHRYTISGGGENVWATADAFQFVWKKMEGDFTLTADISILGQGGDPHKKAMLMARQSLDSDSAYADVALHAVGLTSLQSRDAKGADTHEIQSNISAPKKLRLQKYGDEFTLWIAGADGKFFFSGAAMRVPLTGPFYVGLGVCAHNKDVVETAEFSNVEAATVSPERTAQAHSTLETIDVASTDRRVIYVSSSQLGVPNWTPDGVSLVFTHDGRIERVPVAGGEPKLIDTGFLRGSNGFHGISPDGKWLAITDESHVRGMAICVVPIGGGVPRRVTPQSPSVWQGWSPDGKTIVFAALRVGELGIYTTPVAGGKEKRLADAADNGTAEYSPDGVYIYFNSDRSGAMEIWRMRPDGSKPEQVTKDGAGNWFPHVSPDGRRLAFLTPLQRNSQYLQPFPLDIEPVALRVMTLADGQIRGLAKLMGGVETMPAPSWSPDSRRLAFVSYQGIKAGALSPDLRRPRIVK
jgi:Tol biopolymer transport system component